MTLSILNIPFSYLYFKQLSETVAPRENAWRQFRIASNKANISGHTALPFESFILPFLSIIALIAVYEYADTGRRSGRALFFVFLAVGYQMINGARSEVLLVLDVYKRQPVDRAQRTDSDEGARSDGRNSSPDKCAHHWNRAEQVRYRGERGLQSLSPLLYGGGERLKHSCRRVAHWPGSMQPFVISDSFAFLRGTPNQGDKRNGDPAST